MIRATELAGRAVVDIDAAEKIGTIDKIILDPDGKQVAGFVVTRVGSSFPAARPSQSSHRSRSTPLACRPYRGRAMNKWGYAAPPSPIERASSHVEELESNPRVRRLEGTISETVLELADGPVVGHASGFPGRLDACL